ncbi:MAG: hypothetical protein QNJ44_19725 [Rhodobacter sp.]|nr:hypothetical protein [Rhodobacter sp.]
MALNTRLDGLEVGNSAALKIQYEPELPNGVLPGGPVSHMDQNGKPDATLAEAMEAMSGFAAGIVRATEALPSRI